VYRSASLKIARRAPLSSCLGPVVAPTTLRASELGLVSRHPAAADLLRLVYETLCRNKVRFGLTSVGIAIGTASLILVVTIGMTGKQYLLEQVQSIGSNEIWAEYESGLPRITTSDLDYLTLEDMQAVQARVPDAVAASPVVALGERVSLGNGMERDLKVLGVSADYSTIRNLVLVSGRFFDSQDDKLRNKTCVITQSLAREIYGSPEVAIGKILRLNELPLTVIGTFKERVETFGQTEITDGTMLIPYSVSRYLNDSPYVKMLYFSVNSPSIVSEATERIREILVSRHRAESVYTVENLSQLVALANQVTQTLTLVLLTIAAVTLIVGGVGVMNIMFVTVSTRVQEIGIRKAFGATARDIRTQFLLESIMISLVGGLIGLFVGFGIPLAIRWTTEYVVPVSGVSAIVGMLTCSLIGILFGTLPAAKAAKLHPVDSLRFE
jgi:putative ABC transport system permease protein